MEGGSDCDAPPPTAAPPPPQTSEFLLVSQESGMWADCFCETHEEH